MTQQRKIKYPSPGDVLWEGGLADYDRALNAAIPQRYFGGMSPLYVILDLSQDRWSDLAERVWLKDGTVFFAEEERSQVEALVADLQASGRMKGAQFLPDDKDEMKQIGKVGIRASGNLLGSDSSQLMK